MNLKVNNETTVVAEGATLADLLAAMHIPADKGGVAVAVNDELAPRQTWAAHALHENDNVLVIRAAQGG